MTFFSEIDDTPLIPFLFAFNLYYLMILMRLLYTLDAPCARWPLQGCSLCSLPA